MLKLLTDVFPFRHQHVHRSISIDYRTQQPSASAELLAASPTCGFSLQHKEMNHKPVSLFYLQTPTGHGPSLQHLPSQHDWGVRLWKRKSKQMKADALVTCFSSLLIVLHCVLSAHPLVLSFFYFFYIAMVLLCLNACASFTDFATALSCLGLGS